MNDRPPVSSGIAFRSFLSHRYKSPKVNEYFFQIFRTIANPQFGVDQGTVATNVTRLERFIRSADGFIGVYPFPTDAEPTIERLKNESRYFRMELDLAERAGKPAMVFIDDRFGSVIAPSPRIARVRFKNQEIQGQSRSPREDDFRSQIQIFCNQVIASRAYDSARAVADEEKIVVGILLPPEDGAGGGYSRQHVDLIAATIRDDAARDVDVFEWPPVIDSRLLTRLDKLDWAVVDLGATSAACGIVAFLHARFVPMMRLVRVPADAPATLSQPLTATLFGAFEVGYPKDIVRWSDETTLRAEMKRRIGAVMAPQRWIATWEQAQQYFLSAALRNEAIFVSYSGKDQDTAAALIAGLRRRFQEVFDYRAQDSPIPAGTPWIGKIFSQLAVSPIGIPLLSPSYFESGNTIHELQEMVARKDAGTMKVTPIKLQSGGLTLPPELGALQYLRLWEYPTAEAAVEAIVRSIDAAAPKS